MDSSRDFFCIHSYSQSFYPPNPFNPFEGLPVYEELNEDGSSFPSTQSSTAYRLKRLGTHRAEGVSVLERLVRRLLREDLPGKEHLASYLRHQHRRNCRASTLRAIYRTVEGFLRFLKNEGRMVLEEMTRWDMEAFIEHEQDRGLKLSTVKTQLATLKAFVRFLIEHNVLKADIFPWKLKIKPPETLPRDMDPDDVKRLLQVKATPRDRAMTLLLLRTGMRIGELLNTTVSDINLKERKVMIYEGLKNRKGRVVYFSDDARDALRSWLEEKDPKTGVVFYGHRGKPLSYPAARMMFVKYLKNAGLSHKGYTLHCLRHTYATALLNAGMRLECLERLLGHTSLEVTRRYARLTDKTREEQYFRAMKIIEGGEIDEPHKRDRELQAVSEKTELLPMDGEELPQQP
jgi:integrase/recombinase XerD